MEERKQDEELPEQAPPAETPEENLEPKPVTGKKLTAATFGVGVALAVGGLLVPAMCASTGTMGATTSSRMKWEQRQAEIRQAVADADAQVAETVHE